MTQEQLMIPRFKVVAGYFDSQYWVGQIVLLEYRTGSDRPFYIEYKGDDENCEWRYESDYKEHPHIFKPLAWYEERAIEDMPEYLTYSLAKYRYTFKVRKIYGSVAISTDKEEYCFQMSMCLPATESDYITYNSTK